MMLLTHILVSFLASAVGCICGIGGGIIIKPLLDALGLYSVSTISFISGCIVLSMTAYSIAKAKLSNESVIEKSVSTFLGIGAALGGITGKHIFDMVKDMLGNTDIVGAVQASALFIVTLSTAMYMLCKKRIRTHRVKKPSACIGIGLALGMLSSFLGIGGGPINLVVLYYFFSMETKTAAQNSLYLIFFSQIASLLFTIMTGTVPDFPVPLFVCMVICGILGGAAGRRINKTINNQTVEKLFMGMLMVIMCICCYNFMQYS